MPKSIGIQKIFEILLNKLKAFFTGKILKIFLLHFFVLKVRTLHHVSLLLFNKWGVLSNTDEIFYLCVKKKVCDTNISTVSSKRFFFFFKIYCKECIHSSAGSAFKQYKDKCRKLLNLQIIWIIRSPRRFFSHCMLIIARVSVETEHARHTEFEASNGFYIF